MEPDKGDNQEKFRKETSEKSKRLLGSAAGDEKAFSKLEERDVELDAERARLEIASFRQDIEERKKFALWVFLMVAIWLLLILVIIFLLGFGLIKLSDSVVISLVGATTVNVTAFFLAVTRYLFPANSK